MQFLTFVREEHKRAKVVSTAINGVVPALVEIGKASEIEVDVFPVGPGEWKRAVAKDAIGYRRAHHRGILVYDAEQSA